MANQNPKAAVAGGVILGATIGAVVGGVGGVLLTDYVYRSRDRDTLRAIFIGLGGVIGATAGGVTAAPGPTPPAGPSAAIAARTPITIPQVPPR